jgi:hypothetical protein
MVEIDRNRRLNCAARAISVFRNLKGLQAPKVSLPGHLQRPPYANEVSRDRRGHPGKPVAPISFPETKAELPSRQRPSVRDAKPSSSRRASRRGGFVCASSDFKMLGAFFCNSPASQSRGPQQDVRARYRLRFNAWINRPAGRRIAAR